MSINLTSTTDSKEAVTAALGDLNPKTTEGEKSAPAQKASETAEASDASEDVEELEAKDESEDSEEDSEEKDDEKPKKKNGGFKKRIDKLNKRLSDKDRETEYWKNEALKARPNQETQAKTAKKETAAEARPKEDNFESHEAYMEALIDWKADQKLHERDAKEKNKTDRAEGQKVIEAHAKRVEEFKKSAKDFDEVIDDCTVPMSQTVRQAFLESEFGPELMYELAKDPDELDRICSLSPVAAARAIGKLEAKFVKASESEKSETKKSKAPAPIKPVIKASGSANKKSIYDENLSQKEYERLREEQAAKGA